MKLHPMVTESLPRNAIILFIISIIYYLVGKIHKKTEGGSVAYSYLYKSTIIMLVSFIFFFIEDIYFSIFGFKENIYNLFDFLFYGILSVGFLYLVIGVNNWGIDLHITKLSQQSIENLKKYGTIILVCGSIVSSGVCYTFSVHETIRIVYSVIFSFIWALCIYLYVPFFKVVKDTNSSWKYILSAMTSGFISGMFDTIRFLHERVFSLLSIIFYAFMGLFYVLGFYKLAKYLHAL